MADESPHKIVNRYPGVKPFSVTEKFLFFGRDVDLEALNSMIFVKQTVVLYGKSGYGKSSLINAGIIPRLKENDSWIYFSIRFNNHSGKEASQNLSPFQTVTQRLAQDIDPTSTDILDTLLPGENSFWYWIKKQQRQTGKLNFILFFDQFEELFTYPREQVNLFSEQLSELLYTTAPVRFKRRIADPEVQSKITDEQHNFIFEKPEVKVLLSIRSDRLSLLNNLTDKHPAVLQHCYELDALNQADARRAIEEPARLVDNTFAAPPFSFTNAAISKILANIANREDGKIEAATLQIVCRYIEDTLVLTRHLSVIDADDMGEITGVFQQYYQSVLNRLSEADRVKARRLIEDELIDEDKRNPLSETFIKNRFGISDSLLLQLEQSSLLRKERDAAGRILYEVSHDTLILAINKEAEGRRVDETKKRNEQLEAEVQQERARTEQLVAAQSQIEYSKVRAQRWLTFFVFMVVLAIGALAVAIYYLEESKRNANAFRESSNLLKAQTDSLENQQKKLEQYSDSLKESTLEAHRNAASLYLEILRADSIAKYAKAQEMKVRKQIDLANIDRLTAIAGQFRGNHNCERAHYVYLKALAIFSKYPASALTSKELQRLTNLNQKIAEPCEN